MDLQTVPDHLDNECENRYRVRELDVAEVPLLCNLQVVRSGRKRKPVKHRSAGFPGGAKAKKRKVGEKPCTKEAPDMVGTLSTILDIAKDAIAEVSTESPHSVRRLSTGPAHPHSGGTIMSSQYWTTCAPNRERLNSDKPIFVDAEFINGLPDVVNVAEALCCDETIRYGRVLLEHLLGGSGAVRRSFAYCSSGTCPITKEELTKHVINQVLQAVLEHIQRLFGTGRTEDVRDTILSILQPKMTASYAELPTVLAVGRVPSHTFLRPHLKHNSYPDPKKTQLAHGFDFHVNTRKLQEIVRRYTEGEQKHLKNRNGNFGMDVVAELVGDLDV
ncbi:hypothetical protein RvY_10180 [Ramazzottius varieornatus]|uniref:Uncharacterized protein n=1 Tax=Ramazzottius varieornatus TaxID=947166 RepID=A0A1D1VKX7_RAMVA|nr:hypothetical protein RvY_10180 [Ramazzottius varieornatus]